MALEDDLTPLTCGTPLERLVDQVTEALAPADPAHQASCPHCQSALRALRQAWGDVEALARQPVSVPRGLRERVLLRIRALLARWEASAVLDEEGQRGETRISDWVIAQVVHRAALRVPGVVLAGVRSVLVDPADRASASLQLRLAVVFGRSLDALGREVRAEVIRRARGQLGVRVASVDIAIEDVVDER